eukprot:Phypoly_transcript_00851.p1 GENE.Phypoly_transcript_00851~~Phypoly_transcript_00851.p1  ORF type:complete len:1234 (+),score=266.85 Phypoly_transcript_00851:200-3901(+)
MPMKRANGPIIDLTDDEPPKRTRPGEPVTVLGNNSIFNLQPENYFNNYSNLTYQPAYITDLHNNNLYNNGLHNNVPQSAYSQNANLQNTNLQHPTLNTFPEASLNINSYNNENISGDKQNEDFNRLLSFFTPVPLNNGATSAFNNPPNPTPGVYTPPNLRKPITSFPIPSSSLPPFPPSAPPPFPPPAPTPVSSSIQYFPTPITTSPIIELDSNIFSQKYPPTPPLPLTPHKPFQGLSYSSLAPSTLFSPSETISYFQNVSENNTFPSNSSHSPPVNNTSHNNTFNNKNNESHNNTFSNKNNNNISFTIAPHGTFNNPPINFNVTESSSFPTPNNNIFSTNNNNNTSNNFNTTTTNNSNTNNSANVNNNINNNNNNSTNGSINITFVDGAAGSSKNARQKKEKDPFLFHVYDPRKITSNIENKNALQRINNFLNQPPNSNDNSNNNNNTSTNNNSGKSAPVMIDLSNINDEDEEEVYFGNLRIKLIRTQLYSGIVSKEENVNVVREISDPQDPDAFAVYNILNVKVGNLDKQPASILAPLVDSSKLRIEGVIPVPKGDLLVQCYGKIADRDDVLAKLKSLDLELGARLDKTELEKLQQNRVKVDKFNMQPDEMLSIPLSGDDLPLTDPPAGLVSPLYPHQKQALTWMLDREKTRPSTLFWKKRGSNYVNSVTNSVVPTPPSDCRGGILGDEMGLGKTLEIISLILASKNADTASGIKNSPSMVVCPLSTLSNWSDQITKHCARNQLSVYLYHGASRTTDISVLSSYDIVVTTYNIVGLEFASNARVPSPLYTIIWKRVVLDEAHLIKNRSTQQTQAAWGLRAACKWCLTGTPIQNKIDDLYSLLRFIRLEPFTDFNWWNRLITRPIKNKDLSGYSRLKAILQHVILRRTKEKHIDLPPRTVYMQTLDFTVEERAYYDSLYRFGKSQFDQYARSGSVLQHYAHVLELLLRLRQTCNHPELVPASTFSKYQPQEPSPPDLDRNVNDLLKTGELDECCICMDKAIEPVATKCFHIYCKTCIFQAISISGNTCPLCRAPVLPRELFPVKFNESEQPKLSVTNYKSSKVDALLLDLRSVRERDPTIKSIIFSQFTSFLDIIQNSLSAHNIRYVRLDGKMSHDQRQDSMHKFETDPTISIFLLSLKAGGVGLNLISASRVYMMDPWWNPAVEDQAIDRVHRLGQTRPVEVIRFVIKGTVEEKIMKLQQRKTEMAASALEAKSKAELQEMRLEELNLLFS